MSGPRPSKCQNCGYSTRYARQRAGELPAYCVNHQSWLCAGCRELRECVDLKHAITEQPARTDIQQAVPPNDGIYGGIPDTVYHSDHMSLSSSGARALLSTTPEEFDYNRREPPNPKPQYDFGHAAHKMVLGEGSKLVRVDAPDWRKGEAQAARNKAWSEGKVPLLRKDVEKAQTMAGRVFGHPVAARLFGAGVAEHSIYWHDNETGVRRRIRPDWLTEGLGRTICVDYKSAVSADPKHFQRQVFDYGYHMQQAYYEDGLLELGIEDAGFLFVVQSKTPPHTVSVCSIDPDVVELGRRQNRAALELFAKCMADDHWPGYDGIHTVGMTGWAVKEIEASLVQPTE